MPLCPMQKISYSQMKKEQREHYTIVDLMRNDLSMVAEHIQVKKFRYIDRIKTQKAKYCKTSSEIYGKSNENWQNQIGDILEKLLPLLVY